MSTNPAPVKVGNTVIKIYRTASAAGYESFQVADFSSGKRKFKTFSNLKKARRHARGVASKLSRGQGDVLTLTSDDRAVYARAVRELAGSGLALDVVAVRYMQAVKELGADLVIEAAKDYASRNRKVTHKRVEDVVKELMDAKSGKSVRYTSDLRYRLNAFTATFHCDISSVTADQIQTFLTGKKLSAQSEINFRRVINTLFEFARRKRYIPHDYDELQRLEKVDNADDGEISIYTPEEMTKLLNAAVPEFVPCLAICAFAGLRSSEVERLRWEHFAWDNRTIRVIGRKKQKRGTPSTRWAPITDNLMKWLAPYTKSAGPVWVGEHDSFYDAQQDTATTAGVKWKANGCRHSFISSRLQIEPDINRVALECGNSASTIHAHYKQLVKKSDSEKWFTIAPATAGNVLLIPQVAG